MAAHGLPVTLSLPLWKGPCAHEKIQVLGGLCTQSTGTQAFEVGVGVKIRDFILYGMNIWIRSADFGSEFFFLLHRQR